MAIGAMALRSSMPAAVPMHRSPLSSPAGRRFNQASTPPNPARRAGKPVAGLKHASKAFVRETCPAISIDIPLESDPLADGLLAAYPKEHGTLRCVVRTSDRKPYDVQLFVEEGNVFLLSARKCGREWVFSAQMSHDNAAPVARLRCERNNTTFTCIRSAGVPAGAGLPGPGEVEEHLHIEQETVQFAEDLPDLNTMRVALSRGSSRESMLSDATTSPVDSPLRGLSQGLLAQHLREMFKQNRSASSESVATLVSRQPKWNERSDSFELPFHGRANWASERNFQLVFREEGEGEGEERVVLLHGKLEDETYALDFSYPLSPLHAFAICLTTYHW